MMHPKILTIALAVVALALAASPALAAKAPHRYSPKHGAKCRKTYKRVKHGKKVYCVKHDANAKKKAPATVAPTPPTSATTAPAPTEKTKLHAHLDPTFTRNPLNPFEVTYEYSASASQQGFVQSLAVSGEEPAPLPPGVLALYSDGRLECAINVGSGVEGSECPVEYEALGQHRVTTIYTSGEESATESEVENIEPLATETTLSVSFEAVTPSRVEGHPLWHIGDISISASASSPILTAQLGCGEGSAGHLTAAGCLQIVNSVEHVYAATSGLCPPPEPVAPLGNLYISDETEYGQIAGEAFQPEELESGLIWLRATVAGGNGFSASEATTALPPIVAPPLEPTC
jgi:hypothetical protein